MKFYDITLEIKQGMITYPGNTKTKIKQTAKIPKDSSNNSELILGSHTGTHVDSKKHVNNSGSGVDKITPDSFYGKCVVLDMTKSKEAVTLDDLKEQQSKIKEGSIVLLRTKNSLRGFNKFNPNFIHVSKEAASFLVKKKIKTLGIDYLSVKKFRSDNGPVHSKLIKNLTLFEGLDLSKIKPGNYLFIGLPLRIKDCDGAPARVILLK
jgi:arylformamidase